ncbi:MAG: SprB repeat-containing protein [Bacteroidetes bacterium]|nr:SprB repeat-containing protein [Bacteroidota bacterium]
MAPSALSATANGSIACYGGTTSVTVTAIGGTSPYTGTGTFTNVTAGNYTYTVSDANGCSTSASINLVEPAPISSSISTVNTTCNLSNGTATATVINGAAPFTYLWSPGGQTTSSITSQPEGNYSVAITDNNGCTGNASALITNTSSVPSEPTSLLQDRPVHVKIKLALSSVSPRLPELPLISGQFLQVRLVHRLQHR